MNPHQAIANTRAHLLSLRNAQGHWEGELSSSALSTATAIVALSLVDSAAHGARVARGARWLVQNQNLDGGWGDTTISGSNLSTTLLCWSALNADALQRLGFEGEGGRPGAEFSDAAQRVPALDLEGAIARCEAWIRGRVGSVEPDAVCRAVIARYGRDRTFSVPILMTCTIGGRLGPHDEAWRRVLALPFELAAFPRSWFGVIGLPVVSYALPALIAIGHARFFHAPPRWWNPLRWLRAGLWPRIRPMLKTLQPSSGGYLEATPLTSFVTMALACVGEKEHPCVAGAVRFLAESQRGDGGWPIDTNLATWVTTLSVKALHGSTDTAVPNEAPSSADKSVRGPVKQWLLAQQYKVVHPFTNAAPGGWAWTDLPGGVPDADDTCGALIALWQLCDSDEERLELAPAVEAGIEWLLDLQNRDGGIPTFCRGWGALPFDRSTPELTAHALWTWWLWHDLLRQKVRSRVAEATPRALAHLNSRQRGDGSWIPLWFGNEHAKDEENPVYGTAKVVACLKGCDALARRSSSLIEAGAEYLLKTQKSDGSWGGDAESPSSIEETALAVAALGRTHGEAVARGARWLVGKTEGGLVFPAAPIGLYFAKLWYHERTYPVIWTLAALRQAGRVPRPVTP